MKNKPQNNPELKLAYEYVCNTSKCLFLTGKAGTGKTTFLHRLKEAPPKRLAVVAPTGVAAINAGGQTIHSLFQLPFGPLVPGNKRRDPARMRRLSRKKSKLLRSLDLLIIDEISMVRADVLDGIDDVLRRYRNSAAPFGGLQLLMIGDLHQLPPVVRDEDWSLLQEYYDTPYFFSSRALQQCHPVTVQLKHIYRQSDEQFIHLLNKVRNNEMDEEVLQMLNARYRQPEQMGDYASYITLSTHNRTARQINEEQLLALPAPMQAFEATIEGEFPKSSFPVDELLHLKVGAQVMFVKNDNGQERRYYNGKIGQVIRIDEEDQIITVQCPGDERPIRVHRVQWENCKYELNERTKEVEERTVGAFTHFPLRLAWAITIHKSQGLTFERVVLDAQAAFAHGQVYVALSRCKTLEGIVLRSRLSAASVRTDHKVKRFSEEAKRNAPDERQLRSAKLAFQQSLLLQAFDFQLFSTRLAHLKRLMLEHEQRLMPGAVQPFRAVAVFTEEEVLPVARRFTVELKGHLSGEQMPEENTALQNRLREGAGWFARQMQERLLPAIRSIRVMTDNQQLEGQIQDALGELAEVAFLKMKAFTSLTQGFSAQRLMRCRTDAAMDYQQSKKAAETDKPRSLSPDSVAHPDLFGQLVVWRRAEARENRVPPYQILPNQALLGVAEHLPGNIPALLQINGLGKRRVERFGKALLEQVSSYCSQKGLSPNVAVAPPERPKRKSDVPKGMRSREYSLQLHKEGAGVDQIARQRQLSRQTIFGHLAHFVREGELPAQGLVSEDLLKAVAAYSDQNQAASLKEIREEFGNKVSYGELQVALAHRHQEQRANLPDLVAELNR